MNRSNLQREDLESALDHLLDGILVTDSSGKLLYCNRSFCRLYKLSAGDVAGSSIKELMTDHSIDLSLTELALKTKKKVSGKYRSKDGKTVVCTISPVLAAGGSVSCMIEQHRSLEELQFYAPDVFENEETAEEPAGFPPALAEFTSPAMQNVYKLSDNMAPKNINLLILGDSGTGKSQLAKRIHRNSLRKEGPFVTIDCSTIPQNLIESELFGYLKGAFSGASSSGKQGLVDVADGGTLFLDEIGELPMELQAKLLQLVQEKTYTPVGGVHPKRVDTRIVAATNRDIPKLISEGKFREDLYYRLAVVTIVMPPLRERPEDIRLLVRHFSNVFNLKHETNAAFSKETLNLLCHYSWPGNIREMEHLIEFLILNSHDKYITPYMLPTNILGEQSYGAASSPAVFSPESLNETGSEYFSSFSSLDDFMEAQEASIIKALYLDFDTSYKLADRLDISQSKASRLIRKYIHT